LHISNVNILKGELLSKCSEVKLCYKKKCLMRFRAVLFAKKINFLEREVKIIP